MALAFLYAHESTYRDLLDKSMAETSEGKEKYRQLTCMAEPDRARVSTTVHQPGLRQRMDLIYPPENLEATREEVVLFVQGFLVDAHLPPIRARSQLASVPVRTQQTVMLSGVSSRQFGTAIAAIGQIVEVFNAQCTRDELLPWSPRIVQGHPTLTLSSRYFTADGGSTKHDMRAFPEDLDPYNILRNAVPDGLYTEDNEVLYYERRKFSNSDTLKYVTVQPTAFKIGQLVQAQLAFMLVPRGKGKYGLILRLRSLCILSHAVTDDCSRAQLENFTATPEALAPRMKRRVGYLAEDEDKDDDVQGIMKKMRLEPVEKAKEADHMDTK
ncbi:hypothetical protein EIP86_000786 [Pleurotus ostreatoroseus]|nr:hypothetical protein EIP86_000786 [Pleurotus ostreatoroseus]